MEAQILSFQNLNGKTAYNPTIPFQYKGKEYIGVRVESQKSELDSKVCYAYKNDSKWMIDESLPCLRLQDPSLVKMGGNLLLTGVHVRKNLWIEWRTDFYCGKSINKLEKIASGPWGMKDIRLVDLGNKIGIFTRPQGKNGGKGKIGYMEISSLEKLSQLSADEWYSAELLNDLFDKNEWGGANQVLRLSEDKLGVIGNIANRTYNKKRQVEKHYRVMSFTFNKKTRRQSKPKIIAERADFPDSPAKRTPELDDVIFPAGIVSNGASHNCLLYVGISDYCCGVKKIPNPFKNNKE